MKVRVHIDALTVEANWPRAGHADFADGLQAALQRELSAAARRGAFAAGCRVERRSLAVPALTLASPQGAGAHIAQAVAGAIAPRVLPVAPSRGPAR